MNFCLIPGRVCFLPLFFCCRFGRSGRRKRIFVWFPEGWIHCTGSSKCGWEPQEISSRVGTESYPGERFLGQLLLPRWPLTYVPIARTHLVHERCIDGKRLLVLCVHLHIPSPSLSLGSSYMLLSLCICSQLSSPFRTIKPYSFPRSVYLYVCMFVSTALPFLSRRYLPLSHNGCAWCLPHLSTGVMRVVDRRSRDLYLWFFRASPYLPCLDQKCFIHEYVHYLIRCLLVHWYFL